MSLCLHACSSKQVLSYSIKFTVTFKICNHWAALAIVAMKYYVKYTTCYMNIKTWKKHFLSYCFMFNLFSIWLNKNRSWQRSFWSFLDLNAVAVFSVLRHHCRDQHPILYRFCCFAVSSILLWFNGSHLCMLSGSHKPSHNAELQLNYLTASTSVGNPAVNVLWHKALKARTWTRSRALRIWKLRDFAMDTSLK